MKYRMLALILALTLVSWAQTATQTTPSTPQTPETKCACCDKMAASDSKDAGAACMGKHDGKEMASCCAGKDDKSLRRQRRQVLHEGRQDGGLLQRQRRDEVRPQGR